jgi:hypothetical protein
MKEILLWRRKLTPWNVPPELTPFVKPIHAVVDDEDFDWLNEYKWFLAQGSDYVQGYIDGSYVLMQRAIMLRHEPRDDPKSWDVRFKDKVLLHCNRDNLEWVPCQRPASRHHSGQRRG